MDSSMQRCYCQWALLITMITMIMIPESIKYYTCTPDAIAETLKVNSDHLNLLQITRMMSRTRTVIMAMVMMRFVAMLQLVSKCACVG
jgi:hypothetical protein